MRKFLKNYWVEIVLLIAVLFALFVMVGNFDVVRSASRSVTASLKQVTSVVMTTINQLVDRIISISFFDLLGAALLVGAVVILYNRARHRYRTNPDNTATICPRCGGAITRIHRSSFDRLLSKTLKPNARRYRCENSSCGWNGLRVQRYRPGRSAPGEN